MIARPTLLWVGDQPAPLNVVQAAGDRWDLRSFRADEAMHRQLRTARLAVVNLPAGTNDDPRRLGLMLNALDRSAAVAVFLLPTNAEAAWNVLGRGHGQYLCIREDASPAEIAAKLEAAAELQPVIQRLQAELEAARRLGSAVRPANEQIDEEMRLAARLQRDFLPKSLPAVDGVSFGVLYRPAGWVSGDIYDVARLDETHVGFNVVDAVGHGLPAALLTMFIKKGLQTKRIVGHTYEIIPPHLALTQLNADICEQDLSSCHFCTAIYGIIDTRTLEVTFARAGHPEPILMRAGGGIESVSAPGSLLGVFAEERYEPQRVQLAAGDRLVLYSDGVEDALRGPDPAHRRNLRDVLAPLAGVPRDEMLLQITSWIDAGRFGTYPEDDVTVLVMDVAK